MCELIIDCPHFTPEWTDKGFVVVRNQNIRDGKLDLSQPSFTPQHDFELRIKRAKPRAGDIIFTREAPMGEVCMIPEGLECCLGQRQVLLRPKRAVSGRYLFFALRSTYVRHQIFWNEGTGSTVSNVRIPVLKALKIPRLGAAEESIGELLGAIDDKIDLNRRMNETLEHLARTLFKDWFVDFGPTKAKQEGREAYLEAGLWALFPERLDSDGKPEGWSLTDIKSLCTVVTNGGTPKRQNGAFWKDGNIPWYKTGELSDSFLLSPSEQITSEGLSGSSAKLLPPGSIIMAIYAAPTVGRLGILTTSATFNQACTGMVPKNTVGTCFLYLCLYFGRNWFNNRANGAAQQNISKAIVESYQTMFPQAQLTTSFNETVEPLFQKLKNNVEESYALAQTRDLLLPKLMSGEMRVTEAAARVAEVV